MLSALAATAIIAAALAAAAGPDCRRGREAGRDETALIEAAESEIVLSKRVIHSNEAALMCLPVLQLTYLLSCYGLVVMSKIILLKGGSKFGCFLRKIPFPFQINLSPL